MFNYFEKQYRDSWWNAVKLLVKKAGLTDLDKECLYNAGLVWVLVYDLTGAIVQKSLKSLDLVNAFRDEIAGKYGVSAHELKAMMSGNADPSPPHILFQEIYPLFDEDYQIKQIRDSEAVQGFHFFAKKIMDNSNLGYLFAHLSEITGSKNK